MFRGSTRFTDIVYIFSSYFFISSPLFNFVFVLYVFTAAFCQQFIKEYGDDDDDAMLCSIYIRLFVRIVGTVTVGRMSR